MIPIGTRIRFTHSIYEAACGDHPEFILAERGGLGRVVGYRDNESGLWPYDVTWDGWPHSFRASAEDFVAVKEAADAAGLAGLVNP